MSEFRRFSVILYLLFISLIHGCNVSERPVKKEDVMNDKLEILVGDDKYRIPRLYMFSPNSPSVDEKTLKLDTPTISVSLPTLAPFTPKNRSRLAHSEDKVVVQWTPIHQGQSYDADVLLKNSLEFELIKRDEKLDIYGLEAYENNFQNETLTFYQNKNRNYSVFIECLYGGLNEICKVYLLHNHDALGLHLSMDATHLNNWENIVNEILKLLTDWRE